MNEPASEPVDFIDTEKVLEKIDGLAEEIKTLTGVLEALQSSVDECLSKINDIKNKHAKTDSSALDECE